MVKNQHNTHNLVIFLLFTLTFPLHSHAQDCVYLSKANDIIPHGKCAPVDVDWEVVYRGVDDKGTGNIQIQYDWDDGNPVEIVNAILTDASSKEWTATQSHVYPNTGDLCNYHPRATLIVNGIVCTSSVQEQIVTVWDTDDKNGGELSIDPQVYPICVGNGASFHFTDNSQWNCTPPDENDVINNENRWIQWIYGTGGTTITDAEVGGSVRAYPWNGPIEYIPGPVEGPIAPFNTSLNITIPNHHPVGAFFQVTLRNWNVCNPYDDPDTPGAPVDPINGDYPPVTTTAMALIVALPDATITPVPSVCESTDPFLLVAADGGGNWSGNGITNSNIGLFDPQKAGAGIHTITYSITDVNGCSDVGTVTITVLEAPKTNINQSDYTNLCPGIDLNLDGNPTDGTPAYTHLWSGDTTPLSNTNTADPEFSTTTIGEYQLIYRVTDSKTCWSEDTITIDVEEVNIVFAKNNIVACTGKKSSLNPSPSGGSETFVFHEWTGTRTDLLSNTNTQTPDFETTEAGSFIYTYTVRDTYGCEDSENIIINTFAQPNANAGTNLNTCGLNNILNAIPSVGNGNWKILNGPGTLLFEDFTIPTPKVSSDAYGTYALRWIEDNNSCIDSADVNISFTEIPLPTVMEDIDTCGVSVLLVANSYIGSGIWKQTEGTGISTFSYASNDTSLVNIDEAGMYKYAWVEDNGNGCIGSDTVQINYFKIPIAHFTPPPAIECTPLKIEFENNSQFADSYYWDFGNNTSSTIENPEKTYNNKTPLPIEFEITLIAESAEGCSDTIVATTSVAPIPVSNFEAENSVGCSPLNTSFTNLSENATSYEWIFGDETANNTDVNTNHTYTNNETFTKSFEINLVATNSYNCTDTSSNYVTVYPKQDFNLSASPDSACSPLNVDFIADPGAYKYIWDFGDGDLTQGAFTHKKLYINDSNKKEKHSITLYTTSVYGCLDTTKTEIVVIPSPKTYFEPNDFSVCSPKTVEFNNTTKNITKSYWDFGNGSTAEVTGNGKVNCTYTNSTFIPADYKIKLVTENSFGCKDSMDGFTSVNPNVKAAITGTGLGCSPLEVSFGNESEGANSFTWNYGNGNSSTGFLGLNTFYNNTDADKTYNIAMIAKSAFGCSDTAYTNAKVYASPNPEFLATPENTQMPESTIALNNLTQGQLWNYAWNFGDETSSGDKDPLTHTYLLSGKYTITLKAYSDFCEASTEKLINILPNIPTVSYGPNKIDCPPLTVDFYSETLDAESFLWEFGDGSISSEANPSHTYYASGEYSVKLTVTGPGGQIIKDDVSIVVHPTPETFFEAYPKVVTIPGEKVAFGNKTSGAVSYLWDFGNGQSSAEENPVYEYTEEGNYDVSLEAKNEFGCVSSYLLNQPIVAEQGGEIDFPNAFTPNTGGAASGEYSFGDKNNHIFYPAVQKGIEEYKMEIYSRWGQLLFESYDIKIGWNGYHNGELCQQGVYVWKVTCRFSTGVTKVFTGDVTLLR